MNTNQLARALAVALTLISFATDERFASFAASTPITVKELNPEYAFQFTNNTVAVGQASYVFVGKVIRNAGMIPNAVGAMPASKFEVEVLENIKGDTKGVVIVHQLGGITNGVYYRVASFNKDPDSSGLLAVGATYMLAIQELDKHGYLLSSHWNQRTVITTNTALARGDVLRLAQPRIAEMLDAYIHEGTSTPLSRTGSKPTKGQTYSSLSPEQRQAVADKLALVKAAIEKVPTSP